MCKVTFFPGGSSIDVRKGTTVYDAAVALGIQINSVCGGDDSCGKCLVMVEGDAEIEAMRSIHDKERANGYSLACRTKVVGDVRVMVPDSAGTNVGKILSLYAYRALPSLTPLVKAVDVNIPAPTIDDNTPDLDRFKRGSGSDEIDIPLPILRQLPKVLRDNGWHVGAVLANEGEGSHRLICIQSGSKPLRAYGLAVDIGTTTIVAELVDLSTGRTIAQASDYNKQMICGEDVLSRIVYAEEHGIERLRSFVLFTIDQLILQLCEQRDMQQGLHSSLDAKSIVAASIGGNTVMVHLLLGLDPTNIRYSPYIPIAGILPTYQASDIGLGIHPNALVYCVPGRAAYVGGDITADILLSSLHKNSELALLIDVGTNGEVVLGNEDWTVSCSTSAGPAFEGGEVQCGMRAMSGAIDSVKISNGKMIITTIDDAPPIGVCGSGLIDLIAQLFLNGMVNKKGTLDLMGVRSGSKRRAR